MQGFTTVLNHDDLKRCSRKEDAAEQMMRSPRVGVLSPPQIFFIVERLIIIYAWSFSLVSLYYF
jgi:hypothetical protein